MSRKKTNELADSLNEILAENGCIVSQLLSNKGKRAYFPSHGILGQSAEAKGSAINATIGTAFEDDGTPLCLECLEDMLKAPCDAFLYAPSFGVRSFRVKWQEMLVEKNPTLRGQTYSLPVVTNALTHALFVAGQLFINRGDKVILPDLYWDNYELLFIDNCDALFSTYKTFVRNSFNVAGLRKRLSEKGEKKIVLLNFPNNPTGYTPTNEEVANIRETLLTAAQAGKKIVVIVDDAYFGLVYEKGIYRESIFTMLASLHENILAIKIDGPTKEDYVWGLRVGFITFAMKGLSVAQLKALEEKAAGLVRGTISSSSHIGQVMLQQAYQCDYYAGEKSEKLATLTRRYNIIRNILNTHKEYGESFIPMPFNSGYFMCVKPRGVDAEVLRVHLLEHYKTGTIVLSGLVRIAFSSVPADKLEALFSHIDAAIRHLKGCSK